MGVELVCRGIFKNVYQSLVPSIGENELEGFWLTRSRRDCNQALNRAVHHTLSEGIVEYWESWPHYLLQPAPVQQF